MALGDLRDRIEIRTYEIWTPLSIYSYVEDITSVFKRKLQAVRCYQSQLVDFRYDRAIRGLNAYRGELAARAPFAEVFGEIP
jgi:LmbE family N-acetylglucosaminyl deacetylase